MGIILITAFLLKLVGPTRHRLINVALYVRRDGLHLAWYLVSAGRMSIFCTCIFYKNVKQCPSLHIKSPIRLKCVLLTRILFLCVLDVIRDVSQLVRSVREGMCQHQLKVLLVHYDRGRDTHHNVNEHHYLHFLIGKENGREKVSEKEREVDMEL